MPDPLTSAEIERMRAAHADGGGFCMTCIVPNDSHVPEDHETIPAPFPCDAAKLLHQLADHRCDSCFQPCGGEVYA